MVRFSLVELASEDARLIQRNARMLFIVWRAVSIPGNLVCLVKLSHRHGYGCLVPTLNGQSVGF